ncbi:MAG: hypothetical protein ABL878_10430 [Burkholderiales bacterium]
MTIESCFGLLGSALLITTAFAAPLSKASWSARWKAVVAVLVLLACFVPIGGLAIAGYLRGIVGDLSITTMLFLAMTVYSRLSLRPWLEAKEQTFWFAAIGAAALFLYPMALGLGRFDPYTLGFGSYGFITAILVVTLVAWRANYLWMTSIILAAASAYLLGLVDSRNLWDYLFDPLLAGYVLFWWLRCGVRKLSAI